MTNRVTVPGQGPRQGTVGLGLGFGDRVGRLGSMQAQNQRYARAYHDIISSRPLQSPLLALKYIPPLGYTMSSFISKSFSATFRLILTFIRHRLALNTPVYLEGKGT